MATLATTTDVYNTCLHILKKRNNELRIEEGESEIFPIKWFAKKDDFEFIGHNPVELLGLIAVYEYNYPVDASNPYWWLIEGEDVYDELLENFIE